jgi:hypothetical protein
LEKALEKVSALPPDGQDLIAIPDPHITGRRRSMEARFAERRDVIRRMAREALHEDERGDTLPLDDLL